MTDLRDGLRLSTLTAEMDVDAIRSEEHTSELQSPCNLVCRLLLAKKNSEIYAAVQSPKVVTSWDLINGTATAEMVVSFSLAIGSPQSVTTQYTNHCN